MKQPDEDLGLAIEAGADLSGKTMVFAADVVENGPVHKQGPSSTTIYLFIYICIQTKHPYL